MKIAIIDDENEAISALKTNIGRYAEEKGAHINVSGYCGAEEFFRSYECGDYDLVLLDIEMPETDGISAAKRIRLCDPDVLIAFITNMKQYAAKGYAVNAVDFVVKPITYYGVSGLLNKTLRILKMSDEREIVLGTAGNVIKLPVSHIVFVEVANHKLTFNAIEGVYEMWGSMSDLEKMLPSEIFSRCNACYTVNLKFVHNINKDEVIVRGHALKISHARKQGFLSDLSRYLGTLR